MKIALFLLLLSFVVSGCMQGHSDDDLRSVPVTNNPHLLPPSAHTAQGPAFGG